MRHYQQWFRYGDPLTPLKRVPRTVDTCQVDGCDRPYSAGGYCGLHFARWKRHGDPLVNKRERQPCSIEGCDSTATAHGWCQKHYKRWQRHGDPAIRSHRTRPTVCQIEGCERLSTSLGLCNPHYKQQWRHGDPLHRERSPQPDECIVPTCTKAADSRGFCFMHYRRWRLYGDPLVRVERRCTPVVDGKKVCLWCREDVPVANYRGDKRSRVGLQPYCKDCALHIAWLNRLSTQYGLSSDHYEAMLVAQGHSCAICQCTPDRRLSVDHDHATGKVRGLLCSHCNHVLGLMEDSPTALRRAADYLERASAPAR